MATRPLLPGLREGLGTPAARPGRILRLKLLLGSQATAHAGLSALVGTAERVQALGGELGGLAVTSRFAHTAAIMENRRSNALRAGPGDHVPQQNQEDAAAAPLNPGVAAAVVDVFVYVVVLNLFVEYFPQVLSETFTFSLLTAVLLKGVLEAVILVKDRVKARFRQASTTVGKVAAAVLLWAVLVGSKFLVLEVVALVFGDRVDLGGFVSVTLLILVLLLSRAAVRRLLQQPTPPHG